MNPTEDRLVDQNRSRSSGNGPADWFLTGPFFLEVQLHTYLDRAAALNGARCQPGRPELRHHAQDRVAVEEVVGVEHPLEPSLAELENLRDANIHLREPIFEQRLLRNDRNRG